MRTGAAITVSEPPKAAITAPANNARLRAFKTTRTKITSGKDKGKTKTTKTRQLFTLKGTSSDPDGIATVAISLRRVALGAAKAPVAPTACIYLEGKTRFVSRRCKTPVYFFVRKDANGNWSYKTKKGAVMRAGTYELTVVAKRQDRRAVGAGERHVQGHLSDEARARTRAGWEDAAAGWARLARACSRTPARRCRPG